MSDPRLFDIDFPEGLGPLGATIGYTGWTGSPRYNPDHWLARGFDGARVHGHGQTLTVNRRHDMTVAIGHRTRHLELVDFEVECGNVRGILAGIDSAPTNERRPLRVDLTGSRERRFQILGPGRWGGHAYQRSGVARYVEVSGITGEHGLWYDHGGAGTGVAFIDCYFHDIEGESSKGTYRPCAGAYPEGAMLGKHALKDGVPWNGREQLLYQRCRFERAGAGIVLQGRGCDLLVSGCVFDLKDHAIGMEDGAEFYALDSTVEKPRVGVPGVDYGQGAAVIEDSIIRCSRNGNALYLTSIEDLTIRRCLILGPGIIQVGDGKGPVGKFRIEGNNTPEMLEKAKRAGWDVSETPRILGSVQGSVTDTIEWVRAA